MDSMIIYAENLADLEAYDDSTRAELLGWMAVYALTGREPDFPADHPGRYVWPALKRKADRAREVYETKSAAGKKGGRPKADEKQTESTDKADEKQNESTDKADAKPVSVSVSVPVSESVSGETETHTIKPQQATRGRARAKAPANCWFDPARPATWADETWRTSDKVRWAVAQRVVDYAAGSGLDMRPGSGGEGAHLVDAMVAAMETGVTPGFFAESVNRSESVGELEDQVLSQLGVMIGSSGMRERYPDWYDRLLSLGMWGGRSPARVS